MLKLFQKPENDFAHIGSIDIDIVIDASQIPEAQYASIVELIKQRGYSERKDKRGIVIPFSFEREFEELSVAIDFLAGEYGGTSKKYRHQRIEEDFLARKARGADVLPEHHLGFHLESYLPDGSKQSCEIKMANIVSILAMKGITISERYKEKDAYDIFAILSHYKEGPTSCIDEVSPYTGQTPVREGLKSICDKFETEDSVGPTWAAKFMEPDNPTSAKLRRVEVPQAGSPFCKSDEGESDIVLKQAVEFFKRFPL
ncbi:MAG TPA: hypothetical protein DF383_06745 [Deltaproteobacteria bacterium]|nr:hypothetical protein [Deltaproteobacteria bacterium]